MQRHEDMESLVAGYALSALEPEEAVAFAEHLASCSQCAELLSEMRALVGAMPLTVPQVAPPPELKARLLQAIRGENVAQPASGAPAGLSPSRRRSFFTRPLALAAAAAALVLALGGTVAWAVGLRDQLEASQGRLANLYDAMTLLAEADQRWEFSGSAIEPGARGVLAYSDAHQASMLMVWDLPPQTQEKTYLAWASADGGRQGAGAMRRANGGLWAVVYGDVADMDSVGITLRDSSGPSGTESTDVVVISLAAR